MSDHERWRSFDSPGSGPAGPPPSGSGGATSGPPPPVGAGPGRPSDGWPPVSPPFGGPPPAGANATRQFPPVHDRGRDADGPRADRRRGRSPLVVLLVLALLGGMVGAGAYWFQPWKLVTDRTVQETLPSVPDAPPASPETDDDGAQEDPAAETPAGDDASEDESGDTEDEQPADGSAEPDAESGADADRRESEDSGGDAERDSGGTSSGDDGNRLLLAGEFIDHEHDTSGTAQLVELADGRRQLVLRDLDTSNGPDLFVRLSDQRVVRGTAGWDAFEKGRFVDVARLKGNRGDQVYDIDPSVDLDGLTSLSIWCKRFSVSFGAASLRAG
ncbi:DM13 domain-containing protein [Micromonospora sp. DT68]|uniref:DM13 domain-containing protein n=1 Tax=Micromonospora TaxID=1873 RepID=UPI0033A1AC16